ETPLGHARQQQPHGVECGTQVQGQDVVPTLRWHVGEGRGVLHAGVVDQHVDWTPGTGLVHQPGERRRIAQVGNEVPDLGSAGITDLGQCRLDLPGAAQPGHCDPRASGGQALGDAQADAGGAAGDEGGAAGKEGVGHGGSVGWGHGTVTKPPGLAMAYEGTMPPAARTASVPTSQNEGRGAVRNDSNSVFRQGGLYRLTAIAAALVLASCAANRPAAESGPPPMESRALKQPVFQHERVSTHREGDDLLTAGLGLSGLQAAQPPAFANPEAPTAFEVRRRAVWSSWRGIADLSPAGGFGRIYGSTASVPGREYAAYATVPGAAHPHRVLVQVPDDFDSRRRCLVVAPSSGSRGVYGAIAVAGPWALPRGCAVAYTDKGAGSDYFDLDADIGFRIDGTA